MKSRNIIDDQSNIHDKLILYLNLHCTCFELCQSSILANDSPVVIVSE